MIIPTPLRKSTKKPPAFQSAGQTVGEVLGDLITKHTALKKHLIDDGGNVRSFVRIYIGEEDIQHLQRENAPVQSNTVVSIIPAIAGDSK